MKKPPPDPLGGHARLYWTLLDSPAYLALSWSARSLYVDLRRTLGRTNNGNISAALGTLKHRGWRSSATLSKAIRELLAVGLIAQTRQGGIANMSKVCSLYRFTDIETWEHPKLGVPKIKETFDYLNFKTLGHARAVIREAHIQSKGKNMKARKLNLAASDSEPIALFEASGIEEDARA